MTLTPSEVASIARRLSFWEFAGYASEALVALGCFGEYVAEYTQWSTEEIRHSLGRRSLLLLIFGISSGLLSLIQTNALSGEVIGSLGDQAKAASETSAKAVRDANAAIGKVKTASDEADSAKRESAKARYAAGQSEALARSAQQNAASLAKDVALVRGQATALSTKLAGALQRADRADAATEQLRRENIEAQQLLANKLAKALDSAAKAASDLEAEREKRLQLAKEFLLPKQRTLRNQSGDIAKLMDVAPSYLVFEFAEPERELAEQINFVLNASHWATIRRSGRESTILPGILISQGSKFPPVADPLYKEAVVVYEERRSTVAALRTVLSGDGMDIDLGEDASDLPPSVLLVRIGTRPNRALESLIKDIGGSLTITPVGPNVFMGLNRTPMKEPANWDTIMMPPIK